MISVVLPVYNAEKHLKEAIESILTQTYKIFELIIINDGSTDNSLAIIKKYEKLDKRIIIINRKNKGLIVSLNDGLKKAKGKYIARMDADDISLPQRFEEQIYLMENEGLDICGGHYLLINDDGETNGLNLTPISHNMCFLSLVSKVPFAHPTVMIRKEFLEHNCLLYGQTEFRIAEDLDLWMRMIKMGAKFSNVNSILFKYRIINDSLSKVNKIGLAKDTKKMQHKFFENNKNILVNILENIPQNLNDEEKSIVVRTVFNLFIHYFNIKLFKHIMNINIKIVVRTILSEIYFRK
jgi:glycosyltransferase involved in cell wall biosynthesis